MDLRNLFDKDEAVQDFPAGAMLFAEGDPAEVMYVILDGEIELRSGGEIIDTLGGGDIVGEMALIDAKARSATAISRSDSRLAAIDEKRFLFLVQETPYFALHVMRVLVTRLRRKDAMSTN